MKLYDAIVIGVGGIGSAAVYHLARRGCKVLGLEQFSIAHDLGSSHGQSRIIRKAYFEDPAYIPLLHKTYDLWSALENECGKQLVHRCGLLLAGHMSGQVISGVQRTISNHQLDIQTLTPDEAHNRFPGFSIPEEMTVMFEKDAGYLLPEAAIQTHVDLARGHGATVLEGQKVVGWSVDQGSVTVETADQHYQAEHLVFCSGAWSLSLLKDDPLPLEVRRKAVFWFDVGDSIYHVDHGCPIFGFDTGDGFYYGFPVMDASGLKTANHSGGDVVSDPDKIDRTLHPEDETGVRKFIKDFLPRANAKLLKHSICMYTMTPDEHFIVDCHRHHPNVFFATGFSGHGFKFAPVLGSALCDLVLQGSTTEAIDFLSKARLAYHHENSGDEITRL